MKTRLLLFLICIALPLWFAAPLMARIVVDDEAPEPGPQKEAIHVPGPLDGAVDESTSGGPAQDDLLFLNKDQLHGTLVSIDPAAGLTWQTPEAHAPIIFNTARLAQIKLSSHKALNTAASAQRIFLTNGDELPGNIVSLDDKTLVLDTWYAGRLSIPRAMLRRIIPSSNANAAIYEGPTGLDGWTVGRVGVGRSWTFHDGALIGSNYGTIGRDVHLPDMSDISFDVVLRGNNQFSIGFYSDRADNFGNCYMLQLSSGYTELQRYSRAGGSNDLGSTQMQNVMKREKSHVELRTNKQKKSIWLLVDGKMIKEWSDPGEFNGDGGSLIFSCQPGTYVKLSNIKVSKWDGKFDDSNSPALKTDEDSVQLENEDKVTGHLESIQDGKTKFASSYAELNIPLERVGQIDMATAHTSQAKPLGSDVRAYFPGGGSVTMQLSQWSAKGCQGSSLNFGKATFSPNAFAKILFNLQVQQPGNGDENSDPDSADQNDHE